MAALLGATAAAALLVTPRPAAAHIEISSHVTRHGKGAQSLGPCGDADDGGPGANVYVYEPGETVAIAWREFIDHPGHYRVAFDPEGSDGFVDPVSADERYSNDAVLLDGVDDIADVHDYEVMVTLPEVECEACTIQVIQVMTDKPPYGDGNDLYYHCIDVQLVEGGGPDMLEEGCGCAVSVEVAGDASGGGAPGLGLGFLFLLGAPLLFARRRRVDLDELAAGRVADDDAVLRQEIDELDAVDQADPGLAAGGGLGSL